MAMRPKESEPTVTKKNCFYEMNKRSKIAKILSLKNAVGSIPNFDRRRTAAEKRKQEK